MENVLWALQYTRDISKVYGEHFSVLLEKGIEVFMYDFTVYGKNLEQCLGHLKQTLIRCVQSDLVLNYKKCHFMVREGKVLGHVVSEKGVQVDKAKVESISKLPYPVTMKHIRAFLGYVGFYRRFIKDFA